MTRVRRPWWRRLWREATPKGRPSLGPQRRMWMLSDDCTSVRLQVPPLLLAGLLEPLRIHIDSGAEMVGEILQRLAVVRAQMLPAPQRN